MLRQVLSILGFLMYTGLEKLYSARKKLDFILSPWMNNLCSDYSLYLNS